MDKSWMNPTIGRCTREYIRGCRMFLEFAWKNRPKEFGEEIYCPCVRCINKVLRPKHVVKDHIENRGILRSYTRWTKHGEDEVVNTRQESNEGDDMHGMLYDALGFSNTLTNSDEPNEDDATESDLNEPCPEDPNEEPCPEEPNEEAKKFYKLLKEADTPLYPGCTKSSKLSFLVRLLHVKCLNRWSNHSFDMLLQVLKDSLPDDINMPKNHYESKKQLRDLGMDCIKIDACPNDCMLYWKDGKRDESKDNCDTCGESRWITTQSESTTEGTNSSKKYKKKAAKVLRYFPVAQRLQRLFMCSKTSKDMRWHADSRTKDNALRHPADSEAWKYLDRKYPTFGSESRNVRLGLASDGFNPFGHMSTTHSTWPVILIPYNLPPWMCMKQPYFLMSLLIPGPSSPGNNIDVYLRPLIDELNKLWAYGIQTFDAYSKQNFQMHAAVLWTINDFPAYANLSGWSTKGKLACPSCHAKTFAQRLQYGCKFCYMNARQFLPLDHVFRKNMSSFDNTIEERTAPKPLTGNDVLSQLHGYDQIIFGKADHDKLGQKRKRTDNQLPHNWKKISIFFELPYWKDLRLRHNLDVMHIEKNNCESWLGTLLNMEGKSKDNLKARKDLELMGIRKSLHPVAKGGNKYYLPPARYTMSLLEKRRLCQFLKDIKVPDNYSSNISRRVQVKECKIHGLKSHDWHVLMQQLLPVAVRGILPKELTMILVELSNFYRQICSKVLWVAELERLEYQIAVTLCKMEMIFPPAFFDIMVHLPIHLAGEAKVAGPVTYRWMYFVERYLFGLKQYVRNKSRPEGSIAEGYLADECLTFCSRYLDGEIETRFNRPGRNENYEDPRSGEKLPFFVENGRGLGKATLRSLTDEEWEQARLYVLVNCDEVVPFIEKHKQEIRDEHGRRISARNVDRLHTEKFGRWFEKYVHQMKKDGETVSQQLDVLSLGPSRFVSSYKGYITNGFRFHTKDHEMRRKTQNSGVFVSAETPSFSSARDMNPVTGAVGYYGVLKDVVELRYCNENRVILFKCDWWDVMSNAGIKKDEYGFTILNFTRTTAASEPFILASQAQQVFYLRDNLDENWRVVLKSQPRDLYDMGSEAVPIQENILSADQSVTYPIDDMQMVNSWTRDEIEGTYVIAIVENNQSAIDDDEDYYNYFNDSECEEEYNDDSEEDGFN